MSHVTLLLFLVFAAPAAGQSWKGDYWKLQLQKYKGAWTIHGLWPEWGNDCKTKPFDIHQISSLVPTLNKVWPSDREDNKLFWQHEWLKHGSCSGMAEYNYFNTAILLRSRVYKSCTSGTTCERCWTKGLKQMCSCSKCTSFASAGHNSTTSGNATTIARV